MIYTYYASGFIWDCRKLPFPSHLGKYIIKIGKISTKIHEIGKIKAIFGLGMTPIQGCKFGQIKSLYAFHIYPIFSDIISSNHTYHSSKLKLLDTTGQEGDNFTHFTL